MKIKEINNHLCAYDIVAQMHFDVDLNGYQYDLVLEMLKDENNPDEALLVYFDNVSDFSIKTFGGGLNQFCGLQIRKPEEYVTEIANYEVYQIDDGGVDDENVHFYCEDVTLLSQS